MGLRQCIKQNCCILQVSRIEPLGEPPIHWRQQVVGLAAFALALPQASEAGGGTQFQGLGLLAAGDLKAARKRLDTLAGFANDGLMIPEQVWDLKQAPNDSLRFGAGTGSATPLAWSMAQFIRLAVSVERGRNVETPRVVWERYGGRG